MMPILNQPHTIRNKFIVPITIAFVLLFLVFAFAIHKYQGEHARQEFYDQTTVFCALQGAALVQPGVGP